MSHLFVCRPDKSSSSSGSDSVTESIGLGLHKDRRQQAQQGVAFLMQQQLPDSTSPLRLYGEGALPLPELLLCTSDTDGAVLLLLHLEDHVNNYLLWAKVPMEESMSSVSSGSFSSSESRTLSSIMSSLNSPTVEGGVTLRTLVKWTLTALRILRTLVGRSSAVRHALFNSHEGLMQRLRQVHQPQQVRRGGSRKRSHKAHHLFSF